MLRDEGYIKYNCHWEESGALEDENIPVLNAWRKQLYAQGLIGVYPDGISYGNVSMRSRENEFIITASQTGMLEELEAAHFAKVVDFDLAGNRVHCVGPMRASSESLSHAAIYEMLPAVNAVFHAHHLALWEQYLHKIPTTNLRAAYGTPEMAFEIQRIIGELPEAASGILLMAGHEEGIISFGYTPEAAGKELLHYFQKIQNITRKK